jgi:hypothetical protein
VLLGIIGAGWAERIFRISLGLRRSSAATSFAAIFFASLSVILSEFIANSRETDTRVGLCDLAVYDLAAIERHYVNRTDIAGRYGTVFRSSFAAPANLDLGRPGWRERHYRGRDDYAYERGFRGPGCRTVTIRRDDGSMKQIRRCD